VVKGGGMTFSVKVEGTKDQSVAWSIPESADNSAWNRGARIDTEDSGAVRLTVAADETLESFTVRATSVIDTTKSCTATVTISGGGPACYTITCDGNGADSGTAPEAESAAAGSGTGNNGKGGSVTITGGTVVAVDGIRSATPAPLKGADNSVTIKGGTVNAEGQYSGAGIGCDGHTNSSSNGGAGGTISINYPSGKQPRHGNKGRA